MSVNKHSLNLGPADGIVAMDINNNNTDTKSQSNTFHVTAIFEVTSSCPVFVFSTSIYKHNFQKIIIK